MPLRELKGDIQPTICCLLGLPDEGGVHIGLLVDNELRLRYNDLNCSAPIQHSISNLGPVRRYRTQNNAVNQTFILFSVGSVFGT